LKEILILPPANHSACGGSHLKTVSHFLNQCSSLSASRAQKLSGSALASARKASSSAIDLMCALAANSSGGGKTRSSCWKDSMLVVADDMLTIRVSLADCSLPLLYHTRSGDNKCASWP